MNITISVIVPVYNSELYLNDCLNSIINQTLYSFEIILINDGSTDSSYKIISDFSNKEHRIKVYSQENLGLSATRNQGIFKAQGDYILFVDSDDMIVPSTLETLYNHAINTNADIVLGNAMSYYADNIKQNIYTRYKDLKSMNHICGDECFARLMKSNSFPPMAQLYFIKKEFLINNNLYFKESIIHEDELWSTNVMLIAKHVTLIDFDYYLYRQREGSIMNSDNYDFRIKSLIIVSRELNKLASSLREKDEILTEAIGFIYVKIYTMYHSICFLSVESKKEPPEEIIFFSVLFTEIYHILNHEQQINCLKLYCAATMILSDSNLLPLKHSF